MIIQRPQKSIKLSIIWSSIERFASQGVQFVISMILARLLLPSDYGNIAIAMSFLSIFQVVNETGFGAALMRKQDRDELDISTVFFVNVIFGVFLYCLIFVSAPVVSFLFKEEELTLIIRLLSLSLIINSLVIVQRTLLLISIDFKTMSKASILAAIISGLISVIMAYHDYGVFALVTQSLVYSIVDMLFITLSVKHRPKFVFCYTRFKPIFNYTYKLIGARLLNVCFAECYPMLIGRFYGPSQLGYFNRANSFQVISSRNIVQIIQRVSTPLLCEAQNDSHKMGVILIKFIKITSFVVFPLLFILFTLSDAIISFLLTDKWLESSYILKWMCPIGVLYIFNTLNRNVFNATGRTDLAFRSEFVKKIVLSLMILITINTNIKLVLLGMVIVEAFDCFLSLYYTRSQIGLTITQQLASVVGIFCSSLIMMLVIHFLILFIDNNLLKLITGLTIGSFTYISCCCVFNVFELRARLALFTQRIRL